MRLPRIQLTAAFLVPILCALAGFLVILFDPLPIRVLRNAQFDQFQRWQPRPYVDAPVRIIDIDEESLARLGQWPWPRTRMAELVEKLRAAGVAAIGFDIVFAEADRTSPAAIADLWRLTGPIARSVAALPDHDEAFAQALSGGDAVLGFALTQTRAGDPATFAGVEVPFRYVEVESSGAAGVHAFPDAILPIPRFMASAAGLGAIAFVPDADGVVRRVPMVFQLAGQRVPSLSAELLRVGQDARNYIVKGRPDGGAGVEEIRVGAVRIPTTPQGEVWVHYSEATPRRAIPAWKVFEGQVDEDALAGMLVLVGPSAQGLQDLRFSPLGRVMPGVEAHAQALEQILTGGGLQRPAWATAAEAIAVVVGCLLAGAVALSMSALSGASITAMLIGLVAWAGWWAFSRHGLLLDVLVPAWAVGLTFMLASLIHHFSSERQHQWLKQAFARYVSPNRVQYLVAHPEELALGGKRQECSFVFTDLAGFTSLMERIDPGKAVALLNAYLDPIIAIAFEHQGTLDRIIGDAVAIVFSAPVEQPDHRRRALQCALAIDAFATGYARDLNAKGIPFGATRIGVHAGEVIVGNFGGSTIFDYRALGDPVNTAARLESVNKHLGTRMCVSANVMADSPEVSARPVGRLVLKGKEQALTVMEPVAAADGESIRAPLGDYATAYRLMADNAGEEASLAFQRLAADFPDDPLVRLHLVRLAAGETGDLIVMAEK